MTDEPEVDPLATATTPAWGLPYPSSSDPVAAGASNIHDLAVAVDSKLTALNNDALNRAPLTQWKSDAVTSANGAIGNCGPAFAPRIPGTTLVRAHMALHLPQNFQAYMLIYVYPAAALVYQIPLINSVASNYTFAPAYWEFVMTFAPGDYLALMYSYAGPPSATVTFRGMTYTYGAGGGPGLMRDRPEALPAPPPAPPEAEVRALHGDPWAWQETESGLVVPS